MKELWTERGIKGAKYLAAGVFLLFAKDPALALAQGSHFVSGLVYIVAAVAPFLALVGLYYIGTRHKKPENPPES